MKAALSREISMGMPLAVSPTAGAEPLAADDGFSRGSKVLYQHGHGAHFPTSPKAPMLNCQLLESRHLSLGHVNVRESYPDRKP